MSRRSVEREKAQQEKLRPSASKEAVEAKIIRLHGEGIYTLQGIAKLTGTTYRKVRETIDDHANRPT